MHIKKLFLFFLILLTPSVQADVYYPRQHLTEEQIERVKEVKLLLNGVDNKSLWDTIKELEKSRKPQLNLEMKEAMAKTYSDIVKSFNVDGQKKREWLYSMVC